MYVFIQHAISHAQFEIGEADLKVNAEMATRTCVFIASGIGGFSTIEREHKALLAGGPRRVSPFFTPPALLNLPAGQVSLRFRAKGANSAACTARSAPPPAAGGPPGLIRRDDADAL